MYISDHIGVVISFVSACKYLLRLSANARRRPIIKWRISRLCETAYAKLGALVAASARRWEMRRLQRVMDALIGGAPWRRLISSARA